MDVVSYILSKKYVEDSLAGAGALAGKSAYEIAQSNGFSGSESDWLESLKGKTPSIGDNGNWTIDGVDTGVVASPSLAGYATEEFVKTQIATINLSNYYTKTEIDAKLESIDLSVDLTEYATKAYVQELIDALEMPEGSVGMIALTDQEILEICK